MKIIQQTLSLATQAPIELIDITTRVEEAVTTTSFRDGLVTLISPHTTAYVNLNESESMLQQDMLGFLQKLAPRNRDYRHNRAPIDNRDNAHAHLIGLLMTASVSIPLVDGRLLLGSWQSIFFVELDGPRPARQLHLHLLGQV